MSDIRTHVTDLSVEFDDYPPQQRAKYEGTHIFVGVHIPIAEAKRLTLGTPVVMRFEEKK